MPYTPGKVCPCRHLNSLPFAHATMPPIPRKQHEIWGLFSMRLERSCVQFSLAARFCDVRSGSPLLHCHCLSIFCCFFSETMSHVMQPCNALCSHQWPWIPFSSSCLHVPSVGIASMHHHVGFSVVLGNQTQGFMQDRQALCQLSFHLALYFCFLF